MSLGVGAGGGQQAPGTNLGKPRKCRKANNTPKGPSARTPAQPQADTACPPSPPCVLCYSEEKHGQPSLPQIGGATPDGLVSEQLCAAAAATADALGARALLCFT